MSDEESFIVLEETPSMLQYSLLNSSMSRTSIQNETSNGNLLIKTESLSDAPETKNPIALEKFDTKIPQVDVIKTDPSTPLRTTLAQSFLLGDINCDKMKSYVPSLKNQNQDVLNLQNLIQERNDLKDALQRTNATMRQQYSMVNNWHNNVRELKENHSKELDKYRSINDELFRQNHDLQAKVDELQHLAELSRKKNSQDELRDQWEQQIRSLKLELASKIAVNVEMDEANHEKEKTIGKLRIEIIAIQGLYKNASDEIVMLKAQNECLQRSFEESKELASENHEKINLIQAQCDVYRTDFEIERTQREEMAREREQLLADIHLLKKRNQALVDEAQSYYNETSASLTSTVSNNNVEKENFVCPLCSNIYDKLNDLESHVQSCLEKS